MSPASTRNPGKILCHQRVLGIQVKYYVPSEYLESRFKYVLCHQQVLGIQVKCCQWQVRGTQDTYKYSFTVCHQQILEMWLNSNWKYYKYHYWCIVKNVGSITYYMSGN